MKKKELMVQTTLYDIGFFDPNKVNPTKKQAGLVADSQSPDNKVRPQEGTFGPDPETIHEDHEEMARNHRR